MPNCFCFFTSSIGRKIVVAVTGLLLFLFCLVHLSGNMLIFVGQEAFNDYAYMLHHLLHGAMVWIARIGLLGLIVAHVLATVSLVIQNKTAREPYHFQKTVRATLTSKLMPLSGLMVLGFIIYHILHFTVKVGINDADYTMANGHFDAWQMVVDGFANPIASIVYLVSVGLLGLHLKHGFASLFQTLGLSSQKTRKHFEVASVLLSLLIFVGFASIPILVGFAGLYR